MSYDFQQNLIGKYVWLIETIHRLRRNLDRSNYFSL